MKELLPIGSVVIRVQEPRRVMICGMAHVDNASGIAYDYVVAPWPGGMEHTSLLTYCQSKDIIKILSLGYQDGEGAEIRTDCAQQLEKYRTEHNQEV